MNTLYVRLKNCLLYSHLTSIVIFSCAMTTASASEGLLSSITKASESRAIEQCVTNINKNPEETLDTATRLYETSLCYLCVGCDIGLDQGKIFQQLDLGSIVLDSTYDTAYKLMQQAAELGGRHADYGLATLIYINDVSDNKLTKHEIISQKLQTFKDKLKAEGKYSEQGFKESREVIIKEANLKRHALDFNIEIYTRLLKAAQEGYVPAQFALSEVFARGVGISTNKVQAYAWAATAVAQNPPFGSDRRDRLALYMNPFEITEAESLAEQYMKEHTNIFDRSSVTVMR